MKILIFSDSHGNLQNMRTAVDKEQPDRVFHLGDMISDAQRLSCAYPELQIDAVVGNCDGWTKGDGTLLIEVEGIKFMLTHGHRYQVKMTPALVVQAGKEAGADVVCFGHTHEARCSEYPDGILVVNPGTVGGVSYPASYAVAEVENGSVTCSLRSLQKWEEML